MSAWAEQVSLLLDAGRNGMGEGFSASIVDFLGKFEPEQLGEEGTADLRELLDVVSSSAQAANVIDILYMAIDRYPKNHLTPIHSFLVRQCCQSRSYESARPLVSRTIEQIDKRHNLIYQDHLLYHFYGALCHVVLKNYESALMFLSLTLVVTGTQTSLIQVEAYKKYILLGLIHHGNLLPLPKMTPQGTSRTLETLASTYIELAEAYSADDQKLGSILETKSEEFATDGNTALLNTVMAHRPVHKILQLREIYMTIGLEDLSGKLNLTESQVKQILQTMVDEGRVVATLDSDRFVTFPIDNDTTDEQFAKIRASYKSISDINARITALQTSLELDPDYVAKQVNHHSGTNTGNRNDGSLGRTRDRGKGKMAWAATADLEEGSF